MNATFQIVIDLAHSVLRILHPRANYAHRVIDGHQRWSGADLVGKAKKYGGSYALQRNAARRALRLAGGVVIASKPNGLLVSAVCVGVDDFGDAIYVSHEGVVHAR